eukprot:m.1919 g.1919  ORF g.1919 m.1919 type:complete len:648 (+) comp8044_c0_seq2:486-2429(+)
MDPSAHGSEQKEPVYENADIIQQIRSEKKEENSSEHTIREEFHWEKGDGLNASSMLTPPLIPSLPHQERPASVVKKTAIVGDGAAAAVKVKAEIMKSRSFQRRVLVSKTKAVVGANAAVKEGAESTSGFETGDEITFVDCCPNGVNISNQTTVCITLLSGLNAVPKNGCNVRLMTRDGSQRKLHLHAQRGINQLTAKLELPPEVWPVAETVDVQLSTKKDQALGQGELTFYRPPLPPLPTFVAVPSHFQPVHAVSNLLTAPYPYPCQTAQEPQSDCSKAPNSDGKHYERRIIFCREDDKALIDEFVRLAFKKFPDRLTSSNMNTRELKRCFPEFVHIVENSERNTVQNGDTDSSIYDYATFTSPIQKEELVLPAELQMSSGTALKILWDFKKGTISLDRAVEEGRDYILQRQSFRETEQKELKDQEKLQKKPWNKAKTAGYGTASRASTSGRNSEKTSLYSSDSYGTFLGNSEVQEPRSKTLPRKGKEKGTGKRTVTKRKTSFTSEYESGSPSSMAATSQDESETGYANLGVLNGQTDSSYEENLYENLPNRGAIQSSSKEDAPKDAAAGHSDRQVHRQLAKNLNASGDANVPRQEHIRSGSVLNQARQFEGTLTMHSPAPSPMGSPKGRRQTIPRPHGKMKADNQT